MPPAKIGHRRVPFILILAVGAIGLSPALASAKSDKDRNAEDLARLRRQIKQLQVQIDQTRGQRDELRDELGAIERRISALAAKLRQIRRQLVRDQKKLDALTAERGVVRRKLGVQRKALEKQVRAAYTMGQQQYLKMLLNQKDPATLGRALTYYHYMNRARTRRIDEIKATLNRLLVLEQQIQQHTRQLETLQATQLKDKAKVEAFREQRAGILSRLDRRISGQSQEIGLLRRDEERLRRLIEGLTLYMEELREDVPLDARFEKFKGRLRMPVRTKVRAYFGDPRQGGPLKWEGLFLNAKEGREVYAVYRGRVAFADWFGRLGLLLILDHGDGYMSLYGHNQAKYAEVGDWVETGQVIGAVGNSGGLAEPGLYFEIRHNGRPQDPLKWFRAS